MAIIKLSVTVVLIIMSLQSLAQKITICYGYKIVYNDSFKDSVVSLVGIKYYDNQMRIIKSIALGPEKSDSCWTNSSYDKRGNIVKEITECTDKGVVRLLDHQYSYDKTGAINREKVIQTKPFSEFIDIRYSKDSMIKESYLNEENARKGMFEIKDVDVYNSFGKLKFNFRIDNKGDTSILGNYLYFPIADTSKVRANIGNYIHFNKKSDVVYLNAFNEEEVVDYYDSLTYKGSTIKKYNDQRKITLSKYYNKIKNKITSEVNFIYDNKGHLFQKKEIDFEDESRRVNRYSKGKVIREDYFYGSILDHSMKYVYK